MEKLRMRWPGRPLVDMKGRLVKPGTRKAAALFAYLGPALGECNRKISLTKFCLHCIPLLIEGGNLQRAASPLQGLYSVENDRSLRIDGMESACKKEICNGCECIC